MYKVILSEKAKNAFFQYIQGYEDANVRRFYDSGIWCEDIIIASYTKKASDLFLAISDHMIIRLSSDPILGRKPDLEDPNHFTLITPIQDRTLIIDYVEDPIAYTRTIIELRIFRD